MSPFDCGRAMAQSIVDYISAIPTSFNTEQELQLWYGYMCGELERVQTGHRAREQYNRAERQFQTACAAFAGILVEPSGIRWIATHSAPNGNLKHGQWWIQIEPGVKSDSLPGIVGFNAATIESAKAKLGII